MSQEEEVLLMLFDKEDAEKVVLATGRTVKKTKIIESNGKLAKCCVCNRDLTLETLGRVLPGSMKLYCDEPTCVNDFFLDLV